MPSRGGLRCCGSVSCFRDEVVTKSVNGLDFDVSSGFFQFLAEVLHLRIYEVEVVCQVDIVAPDSFGQDGFVDHMARPEEKLLKDVVFFLYQGQCLSSDFDYAAVRIQFHVSIDDFIASAPAAPSGHALDSRQ